MILRRHTDYLVPVLGITGAQACVGAGPAGGCGLVLARLKGAVLWTSPCLSETDSRRRGFGRAGVRDRHVCSGIGGRWNRPPIPGYRCNRGVKACCDARAFSSRVVVRRGQLRMMTAVPYSDLTLRQLRFQSPDAEELAPAPERLLAVRPGRSLSRHALRGVAHSAFRPPPWRECG
jgi:hypothetical protein